MRVEALSWDSDLFGFKVVRSHGPVNAEAIRAAMPLLRSTGTALVYVFSPALGEGPDLEVLATGGKWVDRKMTYTRTLDEMYQAQPLIHSFPIGRPSIALEKLARESGVYSRFRVDPRMPSRCFEALYDTWILRSALREVADEILVYEDVGGQTLGMVTISLKAGVSRIGLIAVASEARGKGVGTKLIQAAESWTLRNGAKQMEVTTQGANRKACALYEHCGYRCDVMEDVYHLWIDPEVP